MVCSPGIWTGVAGRCVMVMVIRRQVCGSGLLGRECQDLGRYLSSNLNDEMEGGRRKEEEER